MFQSLPATKLDGIIALMQAYESDPRTDKVDLGVGVYRNAEGRTPVMRAVKAAEAQILETQDTKTYLSLAGDRAFLEEVGGLLLGGTIATSRVASVGTPGGTAAVRQICELIRAARPEATIWVSEQTWPNHLPLISAAGLNCRSYRYLDVDSGALDRAGFFADLETVASGDVVLLHGCCHNPTGVDPKNRDWDIIADVLDRRGAVPFVDMAYQGFGEGLDADAAGLRCLAKRLPEVLVAASCSKNFGLYRERVGLAMAIGTESQRDRLAGTLASLNRKSFAFPPDHGGRVVSTILGDPTLRGLWHSELEEMRLRVRENRVALTQAIRAETGSDRYGFVAGQSGMFSLLPLSPVEVETLRADHGIYMLGDGRVNMAGLNRRGIAATARAIASLAR